MTVTLYQFGNSVCCQKVRITMLEKGVEWDSVEVNLFRNEQYAPSYLMLNPKGVVPTILHAGQPIIESTLICEYLDETFPDPPLAPSSPAERSQMRLWSKMVDEGLHEGISEISFCAMFRERLRASTEEQRETRFNNIGDPKRRDRFKSTYEQGPASPFVLYAVASFEKAFAQLEKTLSTGSPWILGGQMSLADINLMPYVARLEFLGLLDLWIDQRPHIKAWWSRVLEQRSFRAGILEPLTEAERAEMWLSGPKIREPLGKLILDLRAKMAALDPTR